MHSEQSASIEHVNVLIVGAGISGTGAAYYLKTMQPAKTFAIVEARYPAIRSDSDLQTFSYEFKPWQHEKAIASADAIMVHRGRSLAGGDGTLRHRRTRHHELRMVIIGSGATAVMLVPAMAQTADAVTMPKLIGRDRAYAVTRRKDIAEQRLVWRLCQRYPRAARRLIRHLKPVYNPWDQCLCAVPDADMFKAIRDGRALVVTEAIDTFTENGIRLQSGRELAADISITATGINLLAFGGINLSVDGVVVDVAEKVAFKGFLLSDVSNFAGPHGRTRAHHLLSAAARSHADPAAAGRRSPRTDLKVLREGPVDDDHLRFTTSASASRLTVKRITRSTLWN
ncbi:NAD(P)/FAD-dependent oxidoreductase [Mycobacterium canettii]|uniref:NAD(P)/FAD-dependent oxidoreductase n=1 Tax=Mycobacterium canetti TaxID=78331 RepID=UPI0002A59FF3|nr:Putative oxidoreductase [Mycobacterium canettii CIPT 140070010]